MFISNSEESSRIFKSDFFEFFSKSPWYISFVVELALMAAMLIVGYEYGSMSTLEMIGMFCLGLAFWSPLEYIFHRFIFHWDLKGKLGKRIHFLIHGVHHDFPNDKLRLITPPALSVIFVIPVIAFYCVFTDIWTACVIMAGTFFGYSLYGQIHYRLHHSKLNSKLLSKWKKFHLEHHYADDTTQFGVTPFGIFWDYVFGTHKIKNK